jgi:hypothetical protein
VASGSCVAGPRVPLALQLRASCPSQRSVPPPCRPGVAKQARLGRRIGPGGSLRAAWVVRVSSQAAQNITRSPPDLTHTHPSAEKRSSAKETRSPSTLSAYSQNSLALVDLLRGSAIVPTISFFLSRAPKRFLLPYIRTRRQPYSPECVEGQFSELRTNGVLRSSPRKLGSVGVLVTRGLHL